MERLYLIFIETFHFFLIKGKKQTNRKQKSSTWVKIELIMSSLWGHGMYYNIHTGLQKILY